MSAVNLFLARNVRRVNPRLCEAVLGAVGGAEGGGTPLGPPTTGVAVVVAVVVTVAAVGVVVVVDGVVEEEAEASEACGDSLRKGAERKREGISWSPLAGEAILRRVETAWWALGAEKMERGCSESREEDRGLFANKNWSGEG